MMTGAGIIEDFKVTIIKMFQEVKNTLEMKGKIESLCRETEYIKRNQVGNFERKNAITKVKNTQDGLKRKTKIINSEFIGRSIEIIQSKQKGKKILKN